MVSYAWQPIADLPDDWEALARPDLDEMLRLWNEERQHLAEPGRALALQERLANLWAIETGVIERLYTIDRGTTESLVELGLGAIEQFSTTGRLTQHAARLIEDQRAALDFVFAYIKDDRPLTQSYIRELHQLLMQHQTHTDAVNQFGEHFQAEAIRGAWKAHPNNPTRVDGRIHEYAPPHLVQDEMDQLIRLHAQHLARGVRPELEAAWLHHRFTQIHPFQDGNGRIARALATMIFLKAGFVPLVVRDDDHRERYLDALETADAGDLGPLVNLFANVVSADLNDAITFVRTMHGRDIKAIAAAAADAAKRRIAHDSIGAHALTDRYFSLAGERLDEIAGDLNRAFLDLYADSARPLKAGRFDGGQAVFLGRGGFSHSRWRPQIFQVSEEYRYEPDLSRYKRVIVLVLPGATSGGERWVIVISFHHKDFHSNTLAAVLFLVTSDDPTGNQDDDVPAIYWPKNEFTYGGDYPQDERFRAWLDSALITALEEWQARI